MSDKIYILKAINSEINFDTDTLNLTPGAHIFVIKAKADGYKDSDFSNEVTVKVGGAAYTIIVPRSVYDMSGGDLNEADLGIVADGVEYNFFPQTIPHNNSTIRLINYNASGMGIRFDNGEEIVIDPKGELGYINTGTLTIEGIYKN